MVDASDHLCVYQKEKTPMHVWAFRFEVLILARQEGKCEFRIANCEFGAISTGKLRIVKDSAIRNSQFAIRDSSFTGRLSGSLLWRTGDVVREL